MYCHAVKTFACDPASSRALSLRDVGGGFGKLVKRSAPLVDVDAVDAPVAYADDARVFRCGGGGNGEA